jgi:pentatricopeptide repeat protein
MAFNELSVTDTESRLFAYPLYRSALSQAGFTPPFPSPAGLESTLPNSAVIEGQLDAIDRALIMLPRQIALDAIGLLKQLDTHTALDLDIFYSFLALSRTGVHIPQNTVAAYINSARASGRVGWAVYIFLHWTHITDTLSVSTVNTVLNILSDVLESPSLLASPRFFPEGFCGLTVPQVAARALQMAFYDASSPVFAELSAGFTSVVDSGASRLSPLPGLARAVTLAEFGSHVAARATVEPDAHTVTAAMRLYGVLGAVDAAADMLRECQQGRWGAVADTPPMYNLLMKLYDQAGQRAAAVRLHAEMVARGVQPDAATLSTILSLLKKEGKTAAMPAVLNAQVAAGRASVQSFNTMITTTLQAGGGPAKVGEVLAAMDQLGVARDIVTFNLLVSMHLNARDADAAKAAYDEALARDLIPTQHTHVVAVRLFSALRDAPAVLHHLSKLVPEDADVRSVRNTLSAVGPLSGSSLALRAAAIAYGARVFGLQRTDSQLKTWVTTSPFHVLVAMSEYLYILDMAAGLTGGSAAAVGTSALAKTHAPGAIAFVMGLESRLRIFSGSVNDPQRARFSRLFAQVLARTAKLSRSVGQEAVARDIVATMGQWFQPAQLGALYEYRKLQEEMQRG